MKTVKEKIEEYNRGYILVDLDAIRNNMINQSKLINAKTKMIAVVKADGYGHGAVPITRELENLDFMFGFAVATAEEAHILIRSGVKKPVIILGQTFPYFDDILIDEGIRSCIFTYEAAKSLSDSAVKHNKKAYIHIKVDTGMGRIGIEPNDEGVKLVKEISLLPNIEIEGIFTHFARADEVDKTFANKQLVKFIDFTDKVRESGVSYKVRHASNSAGILEIKEANLDVVRSGITLYGLEPSSEVDVSKANLKPAMSLISKVAYVKTVKENTPISYGGTFVTDKETVIATIPIGYADGYPRSLSNKGFVLIGGKRAKILGRVCMDQFMVDVTDIPNVQIGDEVVLMGRQGDEYISAKEIGDISGRFNYELICDYGKRLPRVYTRNNEPVYYKDYFEDLD